MGFRSDILDGSDDDGIELGLLSALGQRWDILVTIQADLVRFGQLQGYTTNQITTAITDLFETYTTEWLAYLLVFSDQLVTAISNDATLTWLDLDAGGQTIRARLIGRLT